MGILSNIFSNRQDPESDQSLTIRVGEEAEYLAAAKLILGGIEAGITDDIAEDFINYAQNKGLDRHLLYVAILGPNLIAAAMPILSAGRTALLFTSKPPEQSHGDVIPRLIEEVCTATALQDVQLIQSLVDPANEPMQEDYLSCGFRTMAELVYLHALIREPRPFPTLPDNLYWVKYNEQSHSLFEQAIINSYENSLDCPALNGVRSMKDIIDGHKACGEFNPDHWMLLCEKTESTPQVLGILLLTSSGTPSDVMELVYLGLAPAARGRKLGDLCMQQALATATASHHKLLSLAVDAKNIPALRLYYRAGMKNIASKLAMMRELGGKSPE